MPTRSVPQPMTLANMRANGVRLVEAEASCFCGHSARVDVSALRSGVEVPALRGPLRCSGCGARPMDVRPNRIERVRPSVGMGF